MAEQRGEKGAMPSRYSIELRSDHLYAVLHGRETAEDMRKFLQAVKLQCREHRLPLVLVCIRDSRPVFKAEDYGLSGETRGYAAELVTPACRIALVGDSSEHHHAHEYIELVARQQNVNVRAFKREEEALQWLRAQPPGAAR